MGAMPNKSRTDIAVKMDAVKTLKRVLSTPA
jgi:hypothetical protein